MDRRHLLFSIDRWINAHRCEFVEDLASLIKIPSIARYDEPEAPMGIACKQVLEHFMKLGKKYGFASCNYDDCCASILMNTQPSQSTDELGMLGHLDVVPAGKGWRFDPFCLTEQNGWMIGRGVCDNKGPLLMCLYVMRCMTDLGITLKRNVRLIAGCDEELGMLDVQHYLERNKAPAYTLNCDGAWAMCIAEKGILSFDLSQVIESGNLLQLKAGQADNMIPENAFAVLTDVDAAQLCQHLASQNCYPEILDEHTVKVTVLGVASHCCTPSNGKNAILLLLKLLCDEHLLTMDAAQKNTLLRNCFADEYGTALRLQHNDSISGKTTCVPTLLEFEQGNMLKLHVNMRYAITQPPAFILSALQKQSEKAGMNLHIHSNLPPYSVSVNDPVVRLLLENCQQLIGKKHKPYASGGGTYSRIFPNSIPYGPCTLSGSKKTALGGPHAANEALLLDDLMEGIKVYIFALLQLDAYFEQKKAGNNVEDHRP